MSIIKEICLKYLTLTSRFQGHSRSLELMRIDSPPGPIRYRFQVKRHFQSKIANFSQPPVYLTLPLKKFPLELGTGAYTAAWGQILEWWATKSRNKLDDIFSHEYNMRTWQMDG